MGLPPRPRSSWSDEIAAVAEEFMNATAYFYKGSGANLTLQFSSPARVQHLRGALDASTVTQWATKRAIRLQVPLDATTGMIQAGWIVQLEGCNDPTLNSISLQVQSAVNSSHAALRTVECISEVKPTDRVP